MKEILLTLSLVSIELGDINYSEKQCLENWIGFDSATIEQIQATEKKLNVEFPNDYIEFLKITNGFSAANQVEPSFIKIEEVDYLKNIDPFLIECWSNPAWETGQDLEKSIIIGGKNEEQYFLLIPPKENGEKWKYWTFASWRPGEHEFSNLKSYFEYVIEFNKRELKK